MNWYLITENVTPLIALALVAAFIVFRKVASPREEHDDYEQEEELGSSD